MPAGSLLEEGLEATSWLSPELAAVPSPELQQSWDAVGPVPELLAAERGSPASQGSSDRIARQVGTSEDQLGATASCSAPSCGAEDA